MEIYLILVPTLRPWYNSKKEDDAMIDIPRIRAFLAAAECLNFTEAARRLYITQPTLSKHISLIESDLGFKLFVRSNRSVSLTPEGAFLYQRMRPAIDELDSAVVLARTAGRGEGGVLKVACFDPLCGDSSVNALFSAFLQCYPNVDLQVDFHSFRTLREKLSADEVDVIITKEFEVNVILDEVHHALFTSQPVVVMGVQHPLADRECLTIQELKDQEFIIISPAESLGAYNQLYSCCHIGDFPPSVARYVDNYQALYFYLGLEELIALIDRCDVDNAPACIRAIPLVGLAPIATVAAWKRDNLNPCLGFFRQALDKLTPTVPNRP